MRTLLKVIGGVALLAVFGVVLLNRVAAHRLALYHERWRQEIPALRQRDAAVRMPVLEVPGTDDNAALRYRALLEAVRVDAERYRPALEPAEAGPCTPLPPEARTLLHERRADLAELHEALRGRRVDWAFPYELDTGMMLPQSLQARLLASLLLVEGHQRAQAGDANGAAHNYLQVIRFGADLAAAPISTMNLMGTAVARMGVDSEDAAARPGQGARAQRRAAQALPVGASRPAAPSVARSVRSLTGSGLVGVKHEA